MLLLIHASGLHMHVYRIGIRETQHSTLTGGFGLGLPQNIIRLTRFA